MDSLPLPDYDLFPYQQTDDYRASRSITVQASRGCFYSCTYCCNHYVRSLYPNRDKYLRFRSVGNVISELKFLIGKYPGVRLVRFTDDALSARKEWFEEFALRYAREINLPYSVNDHPHHITAHTARLYRQSGCSAVSLGIENGNSFIRSVIMQRPFSDEDLRGAFSLLRKEGIHTAAFNIFGVPGETFATVLDTVKLNAQCRPSEYYNAYFQPFPQTEAAKLCARDHLFIKDLPGSFFEEPVVALSSISREQLIFGFKYFGLLVAWYKFLYFLSGNKEWAGVRLSDRFLRSHLLPYALLGALMITRMDIKKRFPRLAFYLTQVKRFIFRRHF